MDENIKAVKALYSEDGIAVSDMYNYTRHDLKIWEKEALKSFSKNGKILDIGCGMGREAFCLNQLGFKVIGIDISERVIDAAKENAAARGIDIEFIVTDGLNFPFSDSSFDTVIIWAQTFGLFYGERNQHKILSECRRVLKKGGILSISGHDREYIEAKHKKYLVDRRFYAYANTECYWETFTIDEMKAIAEKAGFEVMSCQRGRIYKEEDGTIIQCLCRK